MQALLYIPRFDEHGAGPRYRVYQYLESFKKLGLTITIKPLFGIQYLNDLYFKKKRSFFCLAKGYLKRAFFLTRHKSKFDMVLMDGELFPFLPYFIEKLFLPKDYIIDQDDAIFHTYDQHRLWIVRKLLSKKIEKIWKKSQHVIVGNSYVKQKAIEMGVKQITVLPTVVKADQYKPSPTVFSESSKNEICIGWVGSPTTIHAIEHIRQALISVAKKTNIFLFIIGANYTLPGVKTRSVDWKNGWSEAEEIKFTNEIDIGIMPLLDGAYEKGKGGFKLIKYMAFAKPMIASPVGVNLEIVDHGINGYLASSVSEWEKYLLMLIEDPLLRQQLGQAGREKMVQKYSFEATSPMMCDIVERALNHSY